MVFAQPLAEHIGEGPVVPRRLIAGGGELVEHRCAHLGEVGADGAGVLRLVRRGDEGTLGAPAATQFIAERLRDHLLPGNIFVLPLRRDITELASSLVRPEHLSTPEHPFALADPLS